MSAPGCSVHAKACVLYCKQCDLFLCPACVDSDAHRQHELCSVEKGLAALREESTACLQRLTHLRTQTARSMAPEGVVRGREDAATSRVEKELLELFSVVESAIAALKEECMRKLWAQKQLRAGRALRKRAHLRNMDRALHALQTALADKECPAHDLQQRSMEARAIIEGRKAADIQMNNRWAHIGEGDMDVEWAEEIRD